MIQESICNSVKPLPVKLNAVKVVTPFLDWVGEPVSIYITEDGHITDGESTINLIKALRAYEEFESWPQINDYFEDYNINRIGGSLDAWYQESPEDILRYIQGVSKLPILFEAKPISDKEDKFITTVRSSTIEILMGDYPNRPSEDVFMWASRLAQPRSFLTADGIRIHSDMSPVSKNKNIQIISHAASSDSMKRTHVASKLFNPLYWEKSNQNIKTVVVAYDVLEYPTESQNLIKEIADNIYEFKNGKTAKMDLAQELAEAIS